MTTSDKINDLQTQNLNTFLEQGPRLSYNYHHWVLARDRNKKAVKLGGLGSMGVGVMWFREYEDCPYPKLEGYNDAPEELWHGEPFR